MQLFDTHAHLDHPQLESLLPQILGEMEQDHLAGVVAIGTTVASSYQCLELAEQNEQVWAAVGIHPNKCKEANSTDWRHIKKLAEHPRVVAIGETGLDRYWDYCPFEIQQSWFDRHIELSNETGKPLVIHMRECEQDILDSLAPYAAQAPVNGIMHSFAGVEATARQCLDWGMYISFAGMVTFKKSTELRAIAKTVPDDRLLIETDAPFLSPHPKRSQRPNHPAMVKHTAECLAEARGCSLEELANLTTRNARALFGTSG